MIKKISLTLTLVSILNTSLLAQNDINKEGIPLPYNVLATFKNTKTNKAFEIRNGGYGSDMVAHPTIKNQFYALTDRGPNATFKGSYGKGKKFPTPNYTPRIGLFELKDNSKINLIKEILLKKPDGTNITGLPNSSSLGGTGETPYDARGKIITIDSTKPYNKKTNPIRLDDYGLDGEGLVALKDGTFWISDEYGPHIVHFDKNGKEIERINAFKNDKRVKYHLPYEFTKRRANRGMEGLAISSDGSTLVGIMQSTMYNPTKEVKKLDATRIVTINPKNGKTSQYLYKQEKPANSNSGIVAINNNKYLLIERDGTFFKGGPKKENLNAQKHIYQIDLSTGTDLESIKESKNIKQDEKLGLMIDGLTIEQYIMKNGWKKLSQIGIKPVSKKLLVDMVKEVNYPHDKMEGMWIIDKNTIGILNDDDFSMWSTKKGELKAKILGNGKIDRNTLYIIKIKSF